jgi:Flp pilus assembly protein TadG
VVVRKLFKINRQHDRKLSIRAKKRASDFPRRSGVAALEAAISIPLLVTIVFGAIELSNAIFLKQSLNIAAYEAAKVVTRPGLNETLARARCGEIMNIRNITDFSLEFSPIVTPQTPRGTAVTVTLTAPVSNLSYGPLRFMAGTELTTSVVMVRL